jgi:hypothetical protein
MMSDREREREYREKLDDAEQRAERSVSGSERRFWLTTAATWRRLLGLPPKNRTTTSRSRPRTAQG